MKKTLRGELFSTDMVQAYLEDRKKHTARPVKSDIELVYEKTKDIVNSEQTVFKVMLRGGRDALMLPKYQPGDYIYCRETFAKSWTGYQIRYNEQFGTYGDPKYIYKADGELVNGIDYDSIKWTPSIHMPREAARLFFKIAKVDVMRVDDVNEKFAMEDGFKEDACDPYARHMPKLARDYFKEFWAGQYGLEAKWMWIYWTEPCSKGEAESDTDI